MKTPWINILVHESQRCAGLKDSFLSLGYDVTSWPLTNEAWHYRPPADVVVFDLNTLDHSVMHYIGSMRLTSDSILYVLASTAEPADQIRALELGADDVQIKPLHIPSFALRVRNALLRRQRPWILERSGGDRAKSPSGYWHFEEHERVAITPEGQVLSLTKAEFHILYALIQAKGKTVLRDRLLAQLSPTSRTGSSESLTTLIYRLRRKLQEAGSPGVIRTTSGEGYRLADASCKAQNHSALFSSRS